MRCIECGIKIEPDWMYNKCYHCMSLYRTIEDIRIVGEESIKQQNVGEGEGK